MSHSGQLPYAGTVPPPNQPIRVNTASSNAVQSPVTPIPPSLKPKNVPHSRSVKLIRLPFIISHILCLYLPLTILCIVFIAFIAPFLLSRYSFFPASLYGGVKPVNLVVLEKHLKVQQIGRIRSGSGVKIETLVSNQFGSHHLSMDSLDALRTPKSSGKSFYFIEGYLDYAPDLVIYQIDSVCETQFSNDEQIDDAKQRTEQCYTDRITLETERQTTVEVYPAALMGDAVYDRRLVEQRFMSAWYCSMIGAGALGVLAVVGMIAALVMHEVWSFGKYQFVSLRKVPKRSSLDTGDGDDEQPQVISPDHNPDSNVHTADTTPSPQSILLKSIGTLTLRRGFLLWPADHTHRPPNTYELNLPEKQSHPKPRSNCWKLFAVSSRFPSETLIHTTNSSVSHTLISLRTFIRVIVLVLGILAALALCAVAVYLFHAFDYSVSQSFIPALFIGVVGVIAVRLIVLYGNRHIIGALSTRCFITNHRVVLVHRIHCFNLCAEYLYYDDIHVMEAVGSSNDHVQLRIVLGSELSARIHKKSSSGAKRDHKTPPEQEFKALKAFFKGQPKEECIKALTLLRAQKRQFDLEQDMIRMENGERLSTDSIVLELMRSEAAAARNPRNSVVVWQEVGNATLDHHHEDDAAHFSDTMSTGSCSANLQTEITGTVVDDLFTPSTEFGADVDDDLHYFTPLSPAKE